jgi:hypothetical protein
MSKIKTPLQVYKLLPQSNCGDCGVLTCMAFAASVIKLEKRLADCPFLDRTTLALYDGQVERQVNIESIQEDALKDLQKKISMIELSSRADRLGARSNGEDSTGRWVPFRELENGSTWSRLFERRCEQPMKQIADSHGELFEDLISMFSGVSSFNNFSSDISVVLYPLPKVPILVCYWKAEDDLESRLHLFFDASAEKNLPIESLFTLGTGLVRMLEKIMHKHSLGKSELE